MKNEYKRILEHICYVYHKDRTQAVADLLNIESKRHYKYMFQHKAHFIDTFYLTSLGELSERYKNYNLEHNIQIKRK